MDLGRWDEALSESPAFRRFRLVPGIAPARRLIFTASVPLDILRSSYDET